MGLGASLLTYFAIDLGIQVAGWAYSYWQQTDKFYDLTGSLTYLTLAGLSLSRSAASPHQLLLSGMVALWAARLGSFLFARVLHAGKDDRLDRIKSQPGTFLLYWTVQAVWVFVVSLPMLLLNASPAAPLGPVAYLGAGIWAAGFAVEAVADHQKDRFRRDPSNKGKWIDSGLWRYSRHPNYFGEITLWTGAALCAASALQPLPAAACFLSPLLSYHLTINVSGVSPGICAALPKVARTESGALNADGSADGGEGRPQAVGRRPRVSSVPARHKRRHPLAPQAQRQLKRGTHTGRGPYVPVVRPSKSLYLPIAAAEEARQTYCTQKVRAACLHFMICSQLCIRSSHLTAREVQ
ncbi:hypothetical protein KFL_002580050 [Klebsormidium nitens]|uniref:Uncharacterized protein n=1 Tax=Klebsormidium nitens TaxID=105231 RepID=A0A1Y1IAY4_KLENI|nr:hypothetical protein KFL_002580050 [Klebsormidium nitens]|eukprot:GAQ85856.1 hypothetical protein KFL_002580050 [Klebsormidium nitens]